MEYKLPIAFVDGGVIISVKAFPGAKRNEIKGIHDGALKVFVTQIAEKGKANDAIRKVLIETFHLKNSQVKILTGETSQQKKFILKGDLPNDVLRIENGKLVVTSSK